MAWLECRPNTPARASASRTRSARGIFTLRASFPPPPLKSICRDEPFPSPKYATSSETTPAVDDPFASSRAIPAPSPRFSVQPRRSGRWSHERHFDGPAWLATPLFTSVMFVRLAKAVRLIHLSYAMPGVPSKYGSGEPSHTKALCGGARGVPSQRYCGVGALYVILRT